MNFLKVKICEKMGTTCLKQKEAEKDSSIKDTIEFNHFYLIKKDFNKIHNKINTDEEGTKIFWKENKNDSEIPIKNDFENSYYISDDIKTNYNFIIGHDAVLNDNNNFLNNKEIISEIDKLFEDIEKIKTSIKQEKENKDNTLINEKDVFKKEPNLNDEKNDIKYEKIKTASNLCFNVNLFDNDKKITNKNDLKKQSTILDMSTLKKMIRKNNISANKSTNLRINVNEKKNEVVSKIIKPIQKISG